ncbi:hypothetical protein [Pyrococcus kukulkanii]|uniref:ScoMcrA-like N-terminal head domain-containing protein n=1 Tax=Pyrococcus kukulkanii TaxID=1609559 RepID=A0A127BCC4_9EURY|nr:hypothetical protein [Pyrococcus kukulkanii]AMM54973.1 hypothetical protein TQ32_04510 [Pyrococcus kukulkanii]
MPVPRNISREDVIKALEEVKANGVPSQYKSVTYFLVYEGKYYPPKYIISLANKYANGEFLSPAEFNTHEAVRHLKRLGFKIVVKEPTGKNVDTNIPKTSADVRTLVDTIEFPPEKFDIEIYRAFEKFASLIEERIKAIAEKRSEANYLYEESEDTVRYMMFYALTITADIDPLTIYLEYPHQNIPHVKYAKIDTYIAPANNRPALAFEMKFKTKIPSERNIPRSQVAGSAFADILRLALFKPNEDIKRYFVYLVDQEMIRYYRNPQNKLMEFFDLEINKGFKLTRDYILFRDKKKTEKRAKWLINEVMKSIGEPQYWPEPTVICRFREDINVNGDSLAIRIYEVVP